MLSINTNLSSIIAQSSMKSSTNKLNEAVERMSTGYRINHAKDNAANYSISTNMTTKLSAYDVAADNVAMGMDMLTTASENLSQIESKLSRLRALATQAQNGTYGRESKEALQKEADSITKEIERLYSTAEYNGVKLLDTRPEIPQGIGLTKDLTPRYDGFIEDPKDYTDKEVQDMDKLSSVNPNTTISSGRYSISKASELKQLADMVNADKVTGGEFVLANDIDLSEYSEGEGWTLIKIWNANCIFNGNGNVISGLYINRPDVEQVGLFKLNVGKIINLGVENCDITGGKMTGAVVGSSRNNTSLVENCYSTGSVSGASRVGGVIGHTYFSKVNACYSEAIVKSTLQGMVGGIGGYFEGSTIKDCYATGDIYSTQGSVAGLIGYADSNIIIDNCYATGDITSNNQSNGGLVGYLSGTINNCYATGDIYKAYSSGGLVGSTDSNINILNSYSTGDIIDSNNPSNYNGGLIGSCSITSDSFIKNVRCYGNITATNCSGGLIGRLVNKTSTLTIKNAVTYTKFENSTLANTKKSGSFIGLNENTADGTSFGVLNISNSKVLSGQNIDKISGCYKLVGGSFQSVSYDMTDMLAGIKEVELPSQDIVLQVGIYSNENSSISFNSKVEYDILKSLKKFDITSNNAFRILDKFLSELSEKQTQLGATQNRLDSALDEITTQYENLASARSTIRDADMAELSSQYIQQQILQEASATLMAVANQSPAIALQLI